jgi:hypothetical protein
MGSSHSLLRAWRELIAEIGCAHLMFLSILKQALAYASCVLYKILTEVSLGSICIQISS